MRMYLLDKKQRVRRWLKDNDFIEAEMTEEINAANQINFSTPLKDRIADNIYYVAIPTPRSKQKYLLFKLLSERVQNDRIEYQGIEEAYDELKQYGYIKDIRPNDRTAQEMLNTVLEPTRWTLGNVPETNHQSTNFYYITYLEALQKIVELFNVELTFEVTIDPKSNKITRRQVNVYSQQGQRTGKRFEYGSNLLTVEREQNSQELVTALVGRGKGELVSEGHDDTPDGYGRRITFADVVWSKKDGHPVDKPAGQEYLVDPEATALYGFSDGNPRIGLTVFEDIEDPVELINATWRALQSLKRPKVSFKADVTDVGQLGLGDTVAIIRHDLKIEYFTRVYKVKHNLLNENDNQIELGDDFSAHSITSSLIKVDEIANEARETAGHAAIAANGKNNNYYSSVQPLAPVEGDIWYKDLGNGETDMYQYHNGGWVFIQSTRDLHIVKNQVEEAQKDLEQAKADIINNKQQADNSLQKLNNSITKLQDEFNQNIPDVGRVTADIQDALQKYTDAQNSIADLTKQAQQQGKDIADVTNTVKGLNINYANLAGDVNSTKVDVKGLQTTVGTVNGDIAQLKLDAQNLQTMLAGKVDNTTYTNFVNLTNQALNARLTASDLNGYAKTVDLQATANGLRVDLNSVTDRMNNLKIGSRNLLHNTSDQYKTLTGEGWMEVRTSSDMYTSVTNYHSGDQFTYAATINNTSDVPVELQVWKCDQNKNRLTTNGMLGMSAYVYPGQKDVRVFLTGSIDNNTRYLQSAIYSSGGQSGQHTIQVKDERLVFGTVSNTWSPNPEDVAQNLTELSSRITANSQQFSSYYTKSETDNRTNSAKSDAVNAIKSDSNWQGLSNILTNSGFLQTADGFLQKVQQTTIPMFNGGGVNLVSGTIEDIVVDDTANTGTQGWCFRVFPLNTELKVGDKITVSADVTLTGKGNLSQWGMSLWSKDVVDMRSNEYSADVGKGSTVTLTVTSISDVSKPTALLIYCGRIGDTEGKKAVFHHLKVERGEIATPYSQAPSDNASQIAFSELSQSLEGLRSTVGSNYGNLQSQINQTATTLRGEVTDKVNGLQGQITTQANNINLMLGTAGDLSNICRNPTFDNHDGWTDSIHVESNWPEIPTKNCGVLFTRDGYYGKEFTVVPGDRYYTSVFANNQNDVDFVLGLHFKMKDGSDQWLGGSRIGAWECRQALGSITVPDNAVTANIWASIQKFDNFGFTRFTNVIVKKNDTLAQINMSAGTTLIQNDKIYMDSSSTIFSGNAFIPSAAITSLNADKITAGTLNAANVNIINLNANNITTGTINGQNLKINLNTGDVEFQHGRIHSFDNNVDINIDQNYISTANWNTRALLKNGELQLTQPNIFDTNGNWYFRLFNGGGAGDAWAGASLVGRDSVIVANKDNAQGATGATSNPLGTATFSGLFTGKGNNNWMPTVLGGAERGVFITGGNQMSTIQNIMDPNDGGVIVTSSPFISVGVDGPNNNWWGNRIVIDGEYFHVPTAWRHTTGAAPNLVVADDGALVRSTSASKYKTEIHRDYSTDYGDRLLKLPTATWIDKGQKERYKSGKRHIKPNKYFGMIAEDLDDAGLDLLVSKNTDGEIEGIQYERIAPALIPVIKKLKDKVERLEKIINE
ncbi:phage tail protein [Limosilactobacillus agrestis]|uniref:Phage tail protein n=1 Tax=Limosilactobacillus agrestis TaxID=2759748 RepID=A0ABS8R7T6_9LACO|nr:phage tail spike protein [Limosilactobacillus agrestis]MCD7130548.1 phage tail protein [Limosilactobacillus agrestis]